MKYFLLVFFAVITVFQNVAAQSRVSSPIQQNQITTDTAKTAPKIIKSHVPEKNVVRDTLKKVVDTSRKDSVVVAKPVSIQKETAISYSQTLKQNPYFNFFGKPVIPHIQVKDHEHKENEFYLLATIILFFGLIRVVFSKYMQNLFTLFFRVSLKQKQIREQLSQTPLPSLLLNIFFVIVTGTFAAFLFRYYNKLADINFWLLIIYCSLTISIIYVLKFFILKFTGWVFNLSAAINAYIFIVFLINKLLAIFLLPLVILIAFQSAESDIWVTISYILIVIALIYRYLASFGPIRSEIKVKQIHFFLYLCAFEIAPLLLIYKVLLNFFEKTV